MKMHMKFAKDLNGMNDAAISYRGLVYVMSKAHPATIDGIVQVEMFDGSLLVLNENDAVLVIGLIGF